MVEREAAVFPDPIIAQQTMGWGGGGDEISLSELPFEKWTLNTKTDLVWYTLTSPSIHLTDRQISIEATFHFL